MATLHLPMLGSALTTLTQEHTPEFYGQFEIILRVSRLHSNTFSEMSVGNPERPPLTQRALRASRKCVVEVSGRLAVCREFRGGTRTLKQGSRTSQSVYRRGSASFCRQVHHASGPRTSACCGLLGVCSLSFSSSLRRSAWSCPCPWPVLVPAATEGSRMRFLTCRQTQSGAPGAEVYKISVWKAGADPSTGPPSPPLPSYFVRYPFRAVLFLCCYLTSRGVVRQVGTLGSLLPQHIHRVHLLLVWRFPLA